MRIVNAYLTFPGNCEEAFTFYKSVFGGEFSYVGRFSEMPPQEGMAVSDAYKNKIMHMSLPLSKETMLMGSDDFENNNTNFGNNISLSITTDSKEDADRIFAMLASGGNAFMPMNQTFWGDYFGMCTDKFNVNWMVSFNEEWMSKMNAEESARQPQSMSV